MPASDWRFAHVVRNRSTCAPAVRMIVLAAWATVDKEGCSLLPVVAIETCTLECYSTMNDKPPSSHMDNQTLEEHGYRYSFSCEVSEPIVFHQGRIIPLLHPNGDYEFTTRETVLCDWPKEEDETRLADKIKKLTADARKKVDSRPAKRNAKTKAMAKG